MSPIEPKSGSAEHYFSKGLKVAREQKAKSLELRLCVSIYDLYQPRQRQNADKYRSQLGEIYGSFSEGFDTTDLARAKARLAYGEPVSH
jgi:hypothetical protein